MSWLQKGNVWATIARLYGSAGPGSRKRLAVLLALSLSAAFAEVVSIGAVVPFLSLLAGELGGERWAGGSLLLSSIAAVSPQQQLTVAAAVFCAAAVTAAVLRIALAWKTQQFVFSFGHQLSVELQRRVLAQPYQWHLQHSSSEQLADLEKTQLVTVLVLLPLVQSAAAALLVATVGILLLQIAPLSTVIATASVVAAYLAIAGATRGRLQRNSDRINNAFAQRIRVVQEASHGIRDVILDGSQSRVLEKFETVNLEVARTTANSLFITIVPRFVVECAGILAIAALSLFLSRGPGGLMVALPVLGALALGAQRLLPLIQQIFQGWSNVAANRAVVGDVASRLNLALPGSGPPACVVPFSRCIAFREVAYFYPGRRTPAVSGLTFEIVRGSRVAIVGRTGSGKSTTADLLMGLLEPTAGTISVDGVPLTRPIRQVWMGNVAHVPQMLFVADATIAENIALAAEIDMDRVRRAASLAHLDVFADSLPEGYATRVGERGAQISGGQRQRLAIARAIYKDVPLLVLDEATHALDAETEASIMSSLHSLQAEGKTIVIIAHHSALIEQYDQVISLERGSLAAAAEISC